MARVFLIYSPRPLFWKPWFWENALYFIVLTTGLVWGAFLATTLVFYGSTQVSLLILLGTLGAITGALAAYSPSLSLVVAYLLFILLPSFFVELAVGGSAGHSVATLIGVVLCFLIWQGRVLNQMHQLRVSTMTLLRRRRRELANRVSRRTAELTLSKEMAESAMRVAESANRTKSDFLANMSHEIRTPMHGVMGLTELALDNDGNPPETSACLRDIKTSAESLLHIVNDILDFSRLEAKRFSLEIQPFDLAECIDRSLNVVRSAALEKSLPIHVSISSRLSARTIGDSQRLQQIITNLVHNAVKFTERGGVSISADLENEGPTSYVHISVADTGCGIPEEKRSEIFQAFAQADNSITRRFGGTGLGLAICAQLSDLMNGRLWLEANESGGSTFHFVFPRDLSINQRRLSLVARA